MSTKSEAPLKSGDLDQDNELRGQDTKKARGMDDAGHSPNEAGTDQKVEDAKREKSKTQN